MAVGLERIRMEGICLEGLSKATKIIIEDSWCAEGESKLAKPEYKSKALPTD
jgi:hypothetical protein